MPIPERARLDAQLLRAHEHGDPAELWALYRQAADLMSGMDDTDAAGFYLTHAYVFALEAGSPVAEELRLELNVLGRI